MPGAPPATASAGSRAARVDGASQIQAIPEEEPLEISSLPPRRSVQRKHQHEQGLKPPSSATVSQRSGNADGSGNKPSAALPPGRQSALKSAAAPPAASGKRKVSFEVEGSGKSSSDGDAGGVPLDEESGGMPQPWLKPLSWLKVQKMSFYQDIGSGTWWDVFFAICVVMSSPGAMAPLPYAVARLTWPGGLAMMVLFWCAAYYTALLLAELHQWRPTMRFCRYRDLARSIWGPKGFYAIFVLQQLASISNNVAAQVESSLVIKDLYETFHGDSQRLSVFEAITMFAGIQLFLCQIPTIRGMRHLNILGLGITVAFVAVVTAGCLYDGQKLDRSTIDHSIPKEEPTSRAIFKVFEAFGILAFSFTNPLLPEIQSVTKPPAVRNGKKGVTAAFGSAFIMYPLIAVSGFWAFGTGVPEIVTIGEFPDTSWLVVTGNILLVVHSAINYQVYARLTLEVIDYLLQDPTDDNMMSPKNMVARFAGSLVYIITVSFISSIMPVHLDEITVIVGALGSITLTLILPPLLFNAVRNPGLPRCVGHWVMSSFWAVILVATVAGAIWTTVVEMQYRGSGLFHDVNIQQQLGIAADRLEPSR